MCISSYDSCTYDAGNEKSFVFELTVTPSPDTAVAVTGLTFYERAPEMFEWINGPTGPNNYPTLYGIRVLKDDVEIYRAADVPTTTDWTLESFDFLDIDEFTVDTTATFRFEFLGYCLIGNGAMVPAWDLDEVRVVASCVSPLHSSGIISGRVLTEFGQKINDVEIYLADEPAFANPVLSITDQSGAYTFSNLPGGDQYYLRGFKNTDFLQGVSTLDLIKIQKHLLGLQLFDSPLQYIAADVTGNNTVSVLDLVDLRKLILGRIQELPGNTSWRFGNPDQDLPLSNPWVFEETMNIPRLDFKQENVNFLAVKIGDVNRSLNNLSGEVETRSNQSLDLIIHERRVERGELVRIDIRSADFAEVAGFQCGFRLHDVVVQTIESGALNMTDAFSVNAFDQTLRMSWIHQEPQTISPGEVLFSIVVESSRATAISEILHLDNTILKAEAYVGDETEVVELRIRAQNDKEIQHGTHLFQNIPNPFSAETEIRFYLDKAGDVDIRIYSVEGDLLYEHHRYFGKGEHAIAIANHDLKMTPGILFYQLKTDDFVESKRMMLLE
jgi:hypothetical protein